MKVIICLIGALTLFKPLFAQKVVKEDSLSNYSYFVYGLINKRAIKQGTAFLVRKNNKVYIGTALHVLSGLEFDNDSLISDNLFPDSVFLRLYRKDNNKAYFFEFDIKAAKILAKHLNILDHPDFLFLEIKVPSFCKIYSIETPIKNYKAPKKFPLNILIYGYPVNDFETNSSIYVRLPAERTDLVCSVDDYNKPFFWSHTEKFDKNILTFPNNEDKIRRGYSGSPVFFIDKKDVKFTGMLIMDTTHENNKTVDLVKPEYIKEAYIELK